jgi:signal transduction histidine kinase
LAGRVQDLETAMICKDGKRIELYITGGPIIMDEMVNGLFLIARDITRSKRLDYDLRREREDLIEQVREHSLKLEEQLSHRAEDEQKLKALASALSMAEFRERERLARILHDSLQQILVALKLKLAVLLKSGLSSESLAEIRSLVDDALDISRSITTELNPPALQGGLVQGLQWLSEWMRQKLGLTVDLKIESIQLSPKREVQVFLFDAVRELLFNTVKHARTDCARVRISTAGDEIRIAVEDDGAGFEPTQLKKVTGEAGGLGLVSIRERTALLGGRFEMESSPGAGSRFRINVPCATG